MIHFKFNMSVIVGASLLFQACGGGGGGDGSGVCRSYCESACAKTANCGFLAHSGVGLCGDSCYQKVQDSGGNDESCGRAGAVLLSATCNQLGTILGFRMQTRIEQDELSSQFDTGSALAQVVEEQLVQ